MTAILIEIYLVEPLIETCDKKGSDSWRHRLFIQVDYKKGSPWNHFKICEIY